MKDAERMWARARAKEHASDERGAALVEFALVSVVFFTIVFLIIQGGIILGSWIIVTNAAREGARYAAPCISRAEIPISGASCTGDWSTKAQAINRIVEYTSAHIAWPDPSDPAYGMNFGTTSYDDSGDPRLVRVRITFGVPLITPLLGAILADPLPLSAESDMRIES